MTEHTAVLASSPSAKTSWSGIDAYRHRKEIALAAYYRSKARGFAPGGETGDWMEAEGEIAARNKVV